MLWIENRDLGKILIAFTLIIFAYYTFWIIVLPFVDDEYKNQVAAYFPPVEIALFIPAATGTFVFAMLLARAYQLVLQDRASEQ